MAMPHVTYDTMEKVRAHWKFCDVLRAHGIPTADSKIVTAVCIALAAAEAPAMFDGFNAYRCQVDQLKDYF